jgi:hypothetical protein
MSSSASIAAARRRRAGGQQIVSAPPPGRGPPPPQNTKQNSQQTLSSNAPPNPFMILQQHHAKIAMLDQQIQSLLTNQEVPTPIPSLDNGSNENVDNNMPVQQKFDLNEVTDLLMSRIEQQLDFKVFYDNDQKLASEIENLNKIIIQQQSTLNHLNKLLYFIISNLKLEYKGDFLEHEDKMSEEEQNINLVIGDHVEEYSEDSMVTQQPTFPKSVKIDLNNNETSEYTPIEDDEEGSNYEPGTEFTEDGLPVPPVD